MANLLNGKPESISKYLKYGLIEKMALKAE